MKKLSTLTKSAIIALSILAIGTIAIASGQIPDISNGGISDSVAIAKSKISLEQAIAIAQKTVKGDLISKVTDKCEHNISSNYNFMTSNTIFFILAKY